MNLYHIKNHNNASLESRKQKCIYINLNNSTSLGDMLFMIANGISLTIEYNMLLKLINNSSTLNIIKLLDHENEPTLFQTITEPREYFYNKIIISNKSNFLIKGHFHSYKYFYHHIDTIKSTLFSKIQDLITLSIDNFKNLSDNKKIVLVYINNDTLIKESYYNIALIKFFLNKNKDDYKIFIFTENININNWTAFKNYNCSYYSGNEEKLFLLMIQCEHFIITNSTLPLIAYYFRNNKDATITFPPIWVDDIFNYNDMIIDEKLHISIINKLNNTHIINLPERLDRRYSSLEQVKKIAYNPKIFRAHKNEHGHLGCSISHIDALIRAKELNLPYIVICEDDIHIENEHYILYVINEIMENYDWNVIMLGGYVDDININRFINKIKTCCCATFYIVNKNYYNTLLDNFKESKKLLTNDMTIYKYQIDVYWFKLQTDKWYITNKKYIYQNIDFSDIDKNLKDHIGKFNVSITDIINGKIIPLEYLDDIPIFVLSNIKDVYNIHPFFFNYKNIIININCIRINRQFIKYSLDLLKNNEYDLLKLQTNYNERLLNDEKLVDKIYVKLINNKIIYNNTAILLGNNSIKKIINNNFNLLAGLLLRPIFLSGNDKAWLDYYNLNS
jgi:GR25 family glycosyltransferase involved in LPS biosynthesis